MACGRIALERCGFNIEKYYASEIDKYAIEVAKSNYPDIIHIGDVRNVTAEDYQDIDLLMGGSPCQGFSFAGKQLNFDDPRSALFFEFVRLLRECKPKYFLLENVRMKKEYQDVITEHLGVEPIMINSSLVSAQNRVRLYWTNIPNIEQPQERGIVLADVLEDNFVADRDKSYCIDANYYKGANWEQYKNKSRRQLVTKPVQVGSASDINRHDILKRVYSPDGKSPTLTFMQGGHREPKVAIVETDNYYQINREGAYPNQQQDRIRKPNKPSNTLTSGTSSIPKVAIRSVSMTEVRNDEANKIRREHKKKTGVDWSPRTMRHLVEREDDKSNAITPSLTKQHIIKEEYLAQRPRGNNKGAIRELDEKSPTLTPSAWEQNNHLVKGIHYRKLTPIECERLQTLPDNYTEGASNTQRYKMIGNGWTVEVIRHIFENMKPPTNKVTSDKKIITHITSCL